MTYEGTHTIEILNISEDVSEITIDLTSDELAVLNRIHEKFFESEVQHKMSGELYRCAPRLQITDLTQKRLDKKAEEDYIRMKRFKDHENDIRTNGVMAMALRSVGLI